MTRVEGRPAPFRSSKPIPPATPKAKAARVAPVTVDTVAEHLRFAHKIPAGVIAGASPAELLGWHTAEHTYRTLEFLRHRHTTTHVDPDEALNPDDRIHQAMLRDVRDGKNIANLAEILDRAAYAQARQMADQPVSPYDRRCIELAQAVAERSARKTRRRGKAA